MEAKVVKKRSIYRVTYKTWLADEHWPSSDKTATVIAKDPRSAVDLISDALKTTINVQDVSFYADVDYEEAR